MKKLFKILGMFFLIILIVIGGFLAYLFIAAGNKSENLLSQLGPEAPTLSEDGFSFRDLNKNGVLDPYEDSRQSDSTRIENLLSQMTLEEKAGTMFITMVNVSNDGELAETPNFSNPFSFILPANSEQVIGLKMNHFNILMAPGTKPLAIWQNNFQKLGERTRLGIPITIGTDPRNHFSDNPLTSLFAGDFSLWPEQLGFAAIGDTVLMHRFADIMRQEYLAVGIRLALHPMADLATEPRWPRNNGTFGEDADLAAKMIFAYVKGAQGDSLGSKSVATMVKHFSGGGPQKDGLDPHFQFQEGQVYPGNNFDYHIKPFEAAFAAGAAQIMPYYGVPMGQTSEDVGFAFNKEIITGLLRDKYQFDGVVTTDWGLVSDMDMVFDKMEAKAHGVMHLSPEDRILKILDAGMDQFGGEMLTDMLVKLVEDGKVSEDRLDVSVRRLLRDKFVLGLFDNPYVDVENALQIVGRADFKAEGEAAQRRSMTLLKNDENFLPLKTGLKIYAEGIEEETVNRYGIYVDDPKDADVAILRLMTPYQSMPGLIAGQFHHGDLDFKGDEKQAILDIIAQVPTIVDIYLDRPAVIPEIAAGSKGLFANYGATDEAVLDVIFGKAKPEGNLPFELPSSMEAVYNQFEDLPYDSKDPLFKFGFGLRYR